MRLDRHQVETQLGWLEVYRKELDVWTQLCEIGQASCQVVRRCGYSRETVAELKVVLGPSTTPAGQQLIAEIISVVEQQCVSCQDHSGPLPGSSEVIESLIGKGKRLLGTSQNNNSLTGQILSIAASTMTLSAQALTESLGRCRIFHVQAWLKEHLKAGIHTARNEDLTDPGMGTKLAQTATAPTPNY